MSEYKDNFDIEEFKLFRKFNNSKERKERHIDSYVLEESDSLDRLEEKVEYNEEKLIKDTIDQIKQMEDYFLDGDNE